MRGRLLTALAFGLIAVAGPRATESAAVRVPEPRRLCAGYGNTTPEEARQHRVDALHAAAVVFTGKVVELNRVTVRFQGNWFWKGEPTKDITLLTGLPPDPHVWIEDIFTFVREREYLVFAYKQSGGLTTNACSRTALLEKATEEVRALDEILPHKVVR